MKEIKFRAWDSEEKVMWQTLTLAELIEGGWEFSTDPYEFTLPQKDYLWSQHDKTIWMQYTGLKDENGKEIYEGDVLGCVSNDDWRRSYYNAKIQVIYNDSKARFEGDRSAKFSHKDIPDILRKEFAVIGNIYENPELLK